MKKLLLILLMSNFAIAQDSPNIILIMADDLGYGDVGFTVFEKKTENGKNYFKATGSGCGSQTFDWQEFKPLN